MTTRSVRFAAEEGGQPLVPPDHADKSRASTQPAASFSMICPNCGSKEIEQHDASGRFGKAGGSRSLCATVF